MYDNILTKQILNWKKPLINREEIKKIIQDVSKNPEQYKKRSSKLDKLLKEEKRELVHLVTVLNVSPKRIYEMMIESGAISGIAYITFYKWIKSNAEQAIEVVEANKLDEAIFEQSSVVNSVSNSCKTFESNTAISERHVMIDSRDLFYGFDMNSELDAMQNPLPQMYEISKEYIFNIFKEDASINNEKIVYILLYEILERGENIFKDIWHFMLIKNGENIQQYYDRLQEIINSNGSYSFGITNATASISDIAFACGCDMYKIIRRNVQ